LTAGSAEMSEADQAALRRIADSVFSRLGERVLLVRKDARIGDWKPKVHYCHDNVRHWVAKNPNHKHVFGFALFDFRVLSGCIRIMPHSAVEDENGVLYDITPHEASQDYPFIRNTGSMDDFAVLATAGFLDVEIQ
jgi:hypothetical protein